MTKASARKARKAADRRLFLGIAGIFILALLLIMSPFLVIGWFRPQAFPAVMWGGMIFCFTGLVVDSFIERRRQLRQIGSTTGEIVPGRLIEARG